jgi:hypothetical protein
MKSPFLLFAALIAMLSIYKAQADPTTKAQHLEKYRSELAKAAPALNHSKKAKSRGYVTALVAKPQFLGERQSIPARH